MVHAWRNIVPLADLSTMPPRAIAELPRFALRRADRANNRRNRDDASWWDQVWISAELAIEQRLS